MFSRKTPSPSKINHRKSLKCVYTNLDGIGNKKADLEKLSYEQNPDIICLTETKTSSEQASDHLYDCVKYEVFRKDRINQRAPGGGVCILVNKDLNVSDVNMQILNDHHFEESVWCEMKCEGNNLVIGTIYRTPSSSRENNNLLLDVFNVCENYSVNTQILLCRDFNYGAINWDSNYVDPEGQHVVDARNFLDKCNDLYFHQHVDQWTHNRELENPSKLDLIITKNNLDIENLLYLAPLGNSHHSVLVFELLLEGSVIEVVDESVRYCHHKGDYGKANDMFEIIEWDDMSEKEACHMFNDFSNHCNTVINECVPTYRQKNSIKRPKWMTSEVWQHLTAKERAWKRLRSRKNRIRQDKYRQERNKANDIVRKAKKNLKNHY